MEPEIKHLPHSSWDALWKSLTNRRRSFSYSGETFRVTWKSTWELDYEEEDRSLRLGAGILRVGAKWYQLVNTVEVPVNLAWTGSNNFRINPEKRNEIIENISIAFDAFQVPVSMLDV